MTTAAVRRGFSLIEVAVATTIASIVGLAAISTFAVLLRQMTRLQAEAGASDEAKTAVDALVSELQGIGGGAVRPAMALWVEDADDPAAAARRVRFGQGATTKADRVTFATARGSSCPIVAWSAGAGTAQSAGTGATCCWSALVDDSGFAELLTAPKSLAHVIVVHGAAHRQVVVDQVNATTCTARFRSGPLHPVATNPAADFTGGVAEAVDVVTLYVDESTQRLMRFRERLDINGADVAVDPSERELVASDVFDLQVQLGFDAAPSDGRLDDRGDTTDEWFLNAAGDTMPAGAGPEDLRMLGLGVIVGARIGDPEYRTTAQVVGGPVISRGGRHLRGAMGRAALRNVAVFF